MKMNFNKAKSLLLAASLPMAMFSATAAIAAPPSGTGTATVTVFNDLNGNGVQDMGEGTLTGLNVSLVNVTAGTVQKLNETSAGSGIYASTAGSLATGNDYTFRVNITHSPWTDWRATIAGTATQSFNAVTGAVDLVLSNEFSISSTNEDFNANMGFVNTSLDTDGDGIPNYVDPTPNVATTNAVLVRIWNDDNADGIRSLGRRSDGGRVMSITLENTSTNAQVTATSNGIEGFALFTGLAAGDYKLVKRFNGSDLGVQPTKITSSSMARGNQLSIPLGAGTGVNNNPYTAGWAFESAAFAVTNSATTSRSVGVLNPVSITINAVDNCGDPIVDGRFVRLRFATATSNQTFTGAFAPVLGASQNGTLTFLVPSTEGAPLSIDGTTAAFSYRIHVQSNNQTQSSTNWTTSGAIFITNDFTPASGAVINYNLLTINTGASCPTPAAIENNIVEGVSLFPVPAVNNLNVSIDVANNTVANYNIVDVTGKVVAAGSWNLIAGNNVNNVNTADFSNGVYMMTVVNNGVATNHKFVVSK